MFAFIGFATFTFANSTQPQVSSKPATKQETTITSTTKEEKKGPPYTYCSTCNGVTYCASSDNQQTAINLFIQMCEALGCC